MRLRERKIASLVSALSIVTLYFLFHAAETSNHATHSISSPLLTTRKAQISDAFQHAWDGYSRYCFGNDTLNPVSNTCQDDFGGWGVTAIDALSTAIIFEKEDVVLEILKFIDSLDFNVVRQGTKIQVFEISIRTFAAMLSAWDLLHGPFAHMAKNKTLRRSLYDHMITLGDALTCAFNTPSGVPRDWVDPSACDFEKGGSNSVAAAGTMILEMARLSDITGNKTYAVVAQRAEEYLLETPPEDELLPGLSGSHIDVDTGVVLDSSGSWGALSDSFYEYLLKAYIYDSNTYESYLDRWKLAADSTIRFIASHPYGYPQLTLLPSWQRDYLDLRMESLSWFAGGNFILGGAVTNNKTLIDFGLSIADTAGFIYNMTKTGLGGEFVSWKTVCTVTIDEDCDARKSLYVSDTKFRLRPEVLETWYHAWRLTRSPKYREWIWTAFLAIEKYCKTNTGYSAIMDVDAPDGGRKLDVQESFVFAEVMKYVYLAHLEDKRATFHVQDSRSGVKNSWVFNTEAHPLRVVGPPK